MKKKLLIVGITMNCAGTEKSFLSFADNLDYDKYDVDLLLAKADGPLMENIPKQINVIEMPDGEKNNLFLLSGKSAGKIIYGSFIKKNPLIAFEILPYVAWRVFDGQNTAPATRMWLKLMKHMSVIDKEYDVAVSYWGDWSMFYMIDKVKAKKKITWLHFDYENPPRDDKTYLKYFSKCDNIVTVSDIINDSLVKKFPSLENRCLMIGNINNLSLIKKLAEEKVDFDPGYTGIKVLSVGRIAEQKGFDLAIGAMKKIAADGIDMKLYIMGEGEEDYVSSIKNLVKEYGLEGRVEFLGIKSNPYPYIAKCDIYLQSARYEGKPITVDEAKMLCKPIVATAYASASEQLEGGALGIITEISEDGIYGGLKKLALEPECRRELEENLVRKDFSNISEMEKFYSIS